MSVIIARIENIKKQKMHHILHRLRKIQVKIEGSD
jgi:hypothetical protein